MKILLRIYRKIAYEIKEMANGKTIMHYNVMMGLISASLIGLIEFFSYFLVGDNQVLYKVFYLYAALLMVIQFIIFLIIYKKNYQVQSSFLKVMITLHPFIILIIGIGIAYINQGYSNQISSFLISVFAISFIQIYPAKNRIILMLFEIIPINLVLFFYHGTSVLFFDGLRLTLMMAILSYIYAMVQYQSFQSRISSLLELEQENLNQIENMKKLKDVYDELESSYKITEAMMLITTEILKNDQLDDVLQLVLEESVKLIQNAQAGSILILSGEDMHFRAAYGYDIKMLRKIVLKKEDLFQSSLKDVFEPAIINNLEVFNAVRLKEEKFNQFQDINALNAVSVLTCSFKFENQFFGLINLDNFESVTAYSERDKYLIKHLAKQVEIAIAIHKLYEKAIRPTKYDELTQAYTRRYHNELLLEAVKKVDEDHSHLSICIIDINRFKEINDVYGHEIGDQCLTYFADCVRENTVENMIFSRIGGDEFTIIFSDANQIKAMGYIEKIRLFMEKNKFQIQDKSELIRFACGISTYPDEGKNIKTLIKLADDRMYEDKAKMK
ncbi:MAG: sensor domain-containing diguanylate cyclase [Firmicutes bacterium]|nr:sensor domain-containing diguanylate cyclase [Bacillota bacterium]